MADVNAIFVADGIATLCEVQLVRQMLLPCGIDGIATGVVGELADGMANVSITLVLVLRCYTEPHPIYVADGICQCSY